MAYTVTKVQYQRNGIGGDGFFAVHFRDRERVDAHTYVAIAFTEHDEEGEIDYRAYWPRVAVVSTDAPDLAWRGADAFGDFIKSAIQKAGAKAYR